MKGIVAIFITLCFFACKTAKVPEGIPPAIQQEIKNFEKTSLCADSHVDKYTFQGSTVYVFENGTCGADMQSDVYGADGKRLGSLGGFTGNTKINGVDFDTASLVGTVWKK